MRFGSNMDRHIKDGGKGSTFTHQAILNPRLESLTRVRESAMVLQFVKLSDLAK